MGMFPHEKALVERLESEPFALLGVNTDRDKERYREQIEDHGITWRSSWQGSTGGPLCKEWHVSGYPAVFLIDHEGAIRNKWVGAPKKAELDAAIDALVAEAKKAQNR